MRVLKSAQFSVFVGGSVVQLHRSFVEEGDNCPDDACCCFVSLSKVPRGEKHGSGTDSDYDNTHTYDLSLRSGSLQLIVLTRIRVFSNLLGKCYSHCQYRRQSISFSYLGNVFQRQKLFYSEIYLPTIKSDLRSSQKL